MSRRIVITCLGSYGDVFPYIGVARALKARGHQPLVATSASYRAAVEQEGIPFAPLGPDVDLRDEAALARVVDARRGGEVVIEEVVLPALDRMYDETQQLAAGADVLVSHPLTFATPAVATARAMPWVCSVLAPRSFFEDFPGLGHTGGSASTALSTSTWCAMWARCTGAARTHGERVQPSADWSQQWRSTTRLPRPCSRPPRRG